MKRFVVLSTLLLFSSTMHAQETASVPTKRDVAVPSTEDPRMKALEEQLRTLAGEVALLRVELAEMRQTRSPEQPSGPQLLLASSHIEPALPPSPPGGLPSSLSTPTGPGNSARNSGSMNPGAASSSSPSVIS